ncbi:MAG: hypothetical protein QOF62_3946 [Pyrinomonadaceae bacterium]|jgi:hypothetical protein|nr:hypothetical protein [Pyrinomonadaceae bacterium]
MAREILTKARALSVQEISPSAVSAGNSNACVTVVERPRTIIMHRIQESELRDLGSAQIALNTNLAFFSLMVGLFSAFATVLLTSHQVLSNRTLMAFCGLTLVSLVFGAFFGVNAIRDRGKVRDNIERLINDSKGSGE